MKKNSSSTKSSLISKKLSFFLIQIFQLMVLLNIITKINSRDISKDYTLLEKITAKDISSNGDNTWVCTLDGDIVKINNQIPSEKREFNMEIENQTELPKCSKIEANSNGSAYIIDEKNILYMYEFSSVEFYRATKIAENVVDIGINSFGQTFYVDNKNVLYKITNDLKIQKYFNLDFDVIRIDVGSTKSGDVRIFLVTKTNNLVRIGIPLNIVQNDSLDDSKLDPYRTNDVKIMDIYANDVAVSSDNRLYVSSKFYGSFSYNESSEEGIGVEFDRIASFGEIIAAGYEIWIVTKEGRIVKTTLVKN